MASMRAAFSYQHMTISSSLARVSLKRGMLVDKKSVYTSCYASPMTGQQLSSASANEIQFYRSGLRPADRELKLNCGRIAHRVTRMSSPKLPYRH